MGTPMLLFPGTSDGKHLSCCPNHFAQGREQIQAPAGSDGTDKPLSVTAPRLRTQSHIKLLKCSWTSCSTLFLAEISQKKHTIHQLGLHSVCLLPKRAQIQKANEIHHGLWDVLRYSVFRRHDWGWEGRWDRAGLWRVQEQAHHVGWPWHSHYLHLGCSSCMAAMERHCLILGLPLSSETVSPLFLANIVSNTVFCTGFLWNSFSDLLWV